MHAVLIRLERSNLSRRVWHCVSISVTSVLLFEAVLEHLKDHHGVPQLKHDRDEQGFPHVKSLEPVLVMCFGYASPSLRHVSVILT